MKKVCKPEQRSGFGDKATGWTIGGLDPGRGEIFVFSKTYLSVLGPAQHPIPWKSGFLIVVQSYGSFKLWRYELACEGSADQTVSALPLIVIQRYASHYDNLV